MIWVCQTIEDITLECEQLLIVITVDTKLLVVLHVDSDKGYLLEHNELYEKN